MPMVRLAVTATLLALACATNPQPGGQQAPPPNECTQALTPTPSPPNGISNSYISSCTSTGNTQSATVTSATITSISGNGGYSGAVSVMDVAGAPNALSFSFSVSGLPGSTTGGIHIHTGTSCSDRLGHYWTPASSPDPWVNSQWTSDSTGSATGYTTISVGYTASQVNGHVVVVHAGGQQVACGVLAESSSSSSSSSSCLAAWEIALISIASGLGVAACVLLGFWFCVLRGNHSAQKKTEGDIDDGVIITDIWHNDAAPPPSMDTQDTEVSLEDSDCRMKHMEDSLPAMYTAQPISMPSFPPSTEILNKRPSHDHMVVTS